MKKTQRYFIFMIVALFCTVTVGAQSTQWHWSCLVNRLSDTDSAFLIDTESKIWKASADDSVKLRVYEGFRYGSTFNISVSKYSTKRMFGDSLPLRRLTDRAELDLAWNHIADTCYVLSYSPLLWHDRPRYGSFGPLTRDTVVWLRVPSASYFPFLKKKEYERRMQLQIDVLADHFGCKRTNDTLSRIVPFTIDSNEYLPQAPYRVLLTKLQDGMLSSKYSSYEDPSCAIRLSKNQSERKVARWDSTNQVQDPNRPGTYISAPIKLVGQPLSLLVHEKWIPVTNFLQEKNARIPEPVAVYRRVVIAYGIRFSNGNSVWFKAQDVEKYLVMPLIDFSVYEQCFRAERFERMKIFTY